jgi:hypothetical protein
VKKLDVVYVTDIDRFLARPTIFLAGPTVRKGEVSWRQAALYYLSKEEYDGAVFVPEPAPTSGPIRTWNDETQIQWEEDCLTVAKCIMFWIPRNIKDMPGLTTNVEWGVWQKSGKVVLGYPYDAEKVNYLTHYAKKYGVPIFHTLEDTVRAAIRMSYVKEIK